MANTAEQAIKYRERAAEVRAEARRMTDPLNIKAALCIVDNYEYLASRIEARIAARKAESVAKIRRALSNKKPN